LAEHGFSDDELETLERDYPEGLSSEAIVGLLRSKGIKLTEATLRKYVQLGLLPRSRRVRLSAGHRGSFGLYPATVVRRIQRLKTMMETYTIDEIKHRFLFVPRDVEELQRTLDRIFGQLGHGAASPDVGEARRLAAELVAKIEAQLQRAPASV
jgi:DNA-binding transcriptional MerR regulator